MSERGSQLTQLIADGVRKREMNNVDPLHASVLPTAIHSEPIMDRVGKSLPSARIGIVKRLKVGAELQEPPR